jgi:hypothetical protein
MTIYRRSGDTFNLLYHLLLAFVLMAGVAGCSSDDAPPVDKLEGLEHNYLLLGEWTAQVEGGEEKLYLSADGTGSCIRPEKTESLKWGNIWKEEGEDYGNYLLLEWEDGSVSEKPYRVDGATLEFDGKEYLLDMPILGAWFIHQLEEGNKPDYIFSVNFLPHGQAYIQNFDAMGIVKNGSTYSWQRAEDGGICLWVDGREQNFSYHVEGGVLTLDGDGRFTQENPCDFYGDWVSVYSQEGEVVSGKYPYSILDIILYGADDKNHIYISYFTEDGHKGGREFIWNNYNDSLLVLYTDGDTYALNYRFRYDFTKEKFFMELSEEEDFSRYVGYARETTNQ